MEKINATWNSIKDWIAVMSQFALVWLGCYIILISFANIGRAIFAGG